ILEESRKSIAESLQCRASEIIFTSGGTEAANIAISGIIKNKKDAHIVCSSIEHPAVLQAVKESGRDFSIVSPKEIKEAIKANTALICLMHSNNEIGTIEPIKKVGEVKGKATL